MTAGLDLFGRTVECKPKRRQLPLPLSWRSPAFGTQLLLGASNRDALAVLENVSKWTHPVAVLYGPRQSGKSLMARHFLEVCPDAVVEDAVGTQSETALFHACNQALASGRPLLLVVTGAPGDWTPSLPDLATRIWAAQMLVIEEPDPELFAALLIQRAAEAGAVLSPELADYVAARTERTYQAIDEIVAELVSCAVDDGKVLNQTNVRHTLTASGHLSAQQNYGAFDDSKRS